MGTFHQKAVAMSIAAGLCPHHGPDRIGVTRLQQVQLRGPTYQLCIASWAAIGQRFEIANDEWEQDVLEVYNSEIMQP